MRGVAGAIYCLMLAPTSQAADLSALKNLRVGMSMEQIESLTGEGFTGLGCSEYGTTGECADPTVTVAAIPGQLTVYLVNTAKNPPAPLTSAERRSITDEQKAARRAAAAKDLKIAAMRVIINSDDHDELLSALRTRNGPVSTASESAYANAFGAVVSGITSHWGDGDVGVDLYQRCGRIDESCLYIQSASLVKLLRRFEEPSTKDRQKDL